MSKQRVVYFYQTFCGLQHLFDLAHTPVTDIHLSSIHFGEEDGKSYIHLNNNPPSDKNFDSVWKDMNEAKDLGIDVSVMIGGAGGGFAYLFKEYDDCYKLLKDFLNKHPEITGVNLDIEEEVDINDVVWLVQDIKEDFPHFTISFAPIAESLQSDIAGMGGFKYSHLKTQIDIDYYTVQFYNSFTATDFSLCVANGYPAEKIVMGMLSDPSSLKGRLMVLQTVFKNFPSMGGSFVWEYFNSYAPPKWAQRVEEIFAGTEYTVY